MVQMLSVNCNSCLKKSNLLVINIILETPFISKDIQNLKG